MPANTSPIFVLTPNTPTAVLSGATTRDHITGNTYTFLFSGGTNGSRLDSITFTNAFSGVTASSAMVQRAYLTDAAGLNSRLIAEVATATVTPSVSVVGAQSIMNFTNGLLVQSGQQIRVGQSVYAGGQDQFHVLAKGGDY